MIKLYICLLETAKAKFLGYQGSLRWAYQVLIFSQINKTFRVIIEARLDTIQVSSFFSVMNNDVFFSVEFTISKTTVYGKLYKENILKYWIIYCFMYKFIYILYRNNMILDIYQTHIKKSIAINYVRTDLCKNNIHCLYIRVFFRYFLK